MDALEAISGIKWYFEAKNLAIKNALRIRCPLSVADQKDLRVNYSQYLANLLAATEILAKDFKGPDSKAHERYKAILYEALDFDSNGKGEANYLYLKELRNSVVHRGADISSSAHIAEDGLPLLIVQQEISNESGKSKRQAFGLYLLDIIEKADPAIGRATLSHLRIEGLLELNISPEKAKAEVLEFLRSSIAVPEHVKLNAAKLFDEIDFGSVQAAQIDELIKLLEGKAVETNIFNNTL